MGEIGRILIVDDDRHIQFVLQAALAKLGDRCEVATASGGEEAWQMLQSEGFDLVISDARSPGTNGVQLTEAMRRLGMRTTVIWMTAHGCQQLHAAAQRLDVFRCLDKPIELPAFREAVRAGLHSVRPRGKLGGGSDARP